MTPTSAEIPKRPDLDTLGDVGERLRDLESRGRNIATLWEQVRVASEARMREFEQHFNEAVSESGRSAEEIDAEEIGILAQDTLGSIKGETGNIMRTEVFRRIQDFLQKKVTDGDISEDTAAEIVERGLAAVARKRSIEASLYDSMRMVQRKVSPTQPLLPDEVVKRFNGPKRKVLAKEMEASSRKFGLGETVNIDGTVQRVKKIEILVGAAMTKVPPRLAQKIIVRNVILTPDGKQFIGICENGCESNLVVGDLEEVKLPPPEKEKGIQNLSPEERKAFLRSIDFELPAEANRNDFQLLLKTGVVNPEDRSGYRIYLFHEKSDMSKVYSVVIKLLNPEGGAAVALVESGSTGLKVFGDEGVKEVPINRTAAGAIDLSKVISALQQVKSENP